MPTSTYIPLANITLGSSATTITFSSLSQSYRDVVLIAQCKSTTSGSTYFACRLNGDSGNNYRDQYLISSSSSNGSGLFTAPEIYGYVSGTMDTTNIISSVMQFMDYSKTDRYKNVLVRENKASEGVGMSVNTWQNTAAVTSITLTGTFASGTTMALYGIAA